MYVTSFDTKEEGIKNAKAYEMSLVVYHLFPQHIIFLCSYYLSRTFVLKLLLRISNNLRTKVYTLNLCCLVFDAM
jgi:hypothetical protein